MNRTWQVKVILTACMISALLIGAGRSLAQIREARQQFDRDERRIERRVEAVQRDFEQLKGRHDELKLDIEKRLTKIETYMGIGLSLLGLLGVGVMGQWGMRLFDLLAQKRLGSKKEAGA